MQLTADLFTIAGQGISGRDLILFFGGLFLLWKSSQEMYHALEGEDETHDEPKGKGGKFIYTIIQIAIIDIVFSLDSVITAVGMVSHVPLMIAAIVVAVLVMMAAAGTISQTARGACKLSTNCCNDDAPLAPSATKGAMLSGVRP